jgi:hypothetical protein
MLASPGQEVIDRHFMYEFSVREADVQVRDFTEEASVRASTGLKYQVWSVYVTL